MNANDKEVYEALAQVHCLKKYTGLSETLILKSLITAGYISTVRHQPISGAVWLCNPELTHAGVQRLEGLKDASTFVLVRSSFWHSLPLKIVKPLLSCSMEVFVGVLIIVLAALITPIIT
ncbi:hypothetical protein [Pseudomonas sp. S9]|uniref:hypothetical protein n=1 Tax=Pseudomonas sp. S9 TaxID=686578 RepID=UPI0002556859|nr:hypothetical protein [Pseudomonas sp. S9]